MSMQVLTGHCVLLKYVSGEKHLSGIIDQNCTIKNKRTMRLACFNFLYCVNDVLDYVSPFALDAGMVRSNFPLIKKISKKPYE